MIVSSSQSSTSLGEIARRHAARAAGCGHQGRRVEVQDVVAGDEVELDREVVLVDLVDAVDERDLGGGDVRRAVVRRVGRVARQREAVVADRDEVAGRGGRLGPAGRRRARRERAALDEAAVRVLVDVPAAVADVDGLVAVVVGIDVPAAARTADRGVQALQGEVERQRRAGLVDARAAVGGDLRMLRGERRLHHRRRLDREALHAPAGRGQGDRQRSRARRRGASPRGGGEDAGERVAVERQRAEAARGDRRRGAVARRRRTAGDVVPGAGRARG